MSHPTTARATSPRPNRAATSAPGWMERTGATPGKLALIAVLAVVLVYVIVSQLPGTSPATTPPRPTTAGESTAADAPAKDNAEEAKPKTKTANAWPRPDMEQVARHDPFAMPEWARPKPVEFVTIDTDEQSDEAKENQLLNQLRKAGAAVVILINGERLAMVDGRRIRVGDELAGYRVKEITESGIVLASEESSP